MGDIDRICLATLGYFGGGWLIKAFRSQSPYTYTPQVYFLVYIIYFINIIFAVYPILVFPFATREETDVPYDFSNMPEGYMSFLGNYIHYGNLTTRRYKATPAGVNGENTNDVVILMTNIKNKTAVIDMDIRYKLGVHTKCNPLLNRTHRFPYTQRNQLEIHIRDKAHDFDIGPYYICNDAQSYYLGSHHIVWNAEVYEEIFISTMVSDWQTAEELLIKFKSMFTNNQNLIHIIYKCH